MVGYLPISQSIYSYLLICLNPSVSLCNYLIILIPVYLSIYLYICLTYSLSISSPLSLSLYKMIYIYIYNSIRIYLSIYLLLIHSSIESTHKRTMIYIHCESRQSHPHTKFQDQFPFYFKRFILECV